MVDASFAFRCHNFIRPVVEVQLNYCHGHFMTLDEYNDFCETLRATDRVVQWGGSHVWKVGGKVFAVAGWGEEDFFAVTFKVTPLSFDILSEQPGLRPAPYLASRGMKWIQHFAAPGLSDEDLKVYIETSHRLVADGLSKKKQKELGLLPA
jgi:predicted DNA-binding protein (MmcQ/YjbR family)